MKKVVLLRSNQILSDSRVEKYLKFYELKNIEYKVLGWDRKGLGVESPNTLYYKRKVGFVVGGLKAALNRVFWFYFIIKQLCRMKDKPEFIHACDLDTAFPAAIYKSFFNPKAFILFDVFDWTSDTQSEKVNKLIVYLTKKMESYALKHSNKILICEEERRKQIPNWKKYDISILPNIPMVENIDSIRNNIDQYKFDNNLITFSYVGWFGKARFLDELLEIAEEGKINLLIAGYGDEHLEKKCHDLSKLSNVKYLGRIPYNKGLELMYNSDLIFAMYCKVFSNHYYAAPNKYYEGMLLGKPILTTKGIIIGDKVEKECIGYTINETKEDLMNIVNSLTAEDLKNRGDNAFKLWTSKYSSYTLDFLQHTYLPLISNNNG